MKIINGEENEIMKIMNNININNINIEIMKWNNVERDNGISVSMK